MFQAIYQRRKLEIVVFICILFATILQGGNAQDVKRFYEIDEINQKYMVNSVAFSPDGKYLAICSDSISLWETKEWKLYKTLREGNGKAVAFSPDGKYFAGAIGRSVYFWETENWASYQYSHSISSSDVSSIAFSPDGKYLVSASGKDTDGVGGVDKGEIKIRDLTINSEKTTLLEHADEVKSIVFSPNGKYLVSGSMDKTIKIWDFENLTVVKTLTEHTDIITSLTYSNDGKYLASGSIDKTFRIWDTVNWNSISRTMDYKIYSVSFSKENFLVVGMEDGIAEIYSFSISEGITKKEKSLTSEVKNKGNIFSIALSSDEKYLAIGSSQNIVMIYGYLPDIKVDIITGKVVSGETANIEVLIRNIGLANADNVSYYIYDRDTLLANGSISLNPNEYQTISVKLKIELFDSSEHLIKVSVNPNKEIREENYTNNYKEVSVIAERNVAVFGIYGGVIIGIIAIIAILFFLIVRISRKKATNSIEEVKALINSMRREGIIPKNAEEKVVIAEQFYSKKQYKKAKETAFDALKTANKTKEIRESLLGAVDTISLKIFELNKKGIKSREGEELFANLKKMIEEHAYENAIDIAVKCVEVLEKAKTINEETAKRMKEFENSLLSIKEPINTFDVKWNISRAKTAFDKKDYEGAIKLIDDAEKKLQSLLEEYKNAKGFLEISQNKIQELKTQGKNTLNLERIYREIKFLFDRREFSKVIENIKKFEDELQKQQ